MKINFITNIPQDSISGGVSGMNRAAYECLIEEGEVNYVGPVNPPHSLWRKIISKSRRLVGLPGEYFFFAPNRLRKIAEEVESRCDPNADLDFYHGFTPWIFCQSSRPYLTWNDCTFKQYMDIYHDRKRFNQGGLNLIQKKEAEWLSNAQRVIFRSEWACTHAVEEYDLDPSSAGVSGNYGMVDYPAHDYYDGSNYFLMITTNFRQKGGDVVLSAFREILSSYDNWKLIIVGDNPGEDAQKQKGVDYVGWLDKNLKEDRDQLEKIIAGARCLVHPTVADTNPMVILEAGAFGCPSIASRIFAIPELIQDGETGLLLDDPASVSEVVSAMRWMISSHDAYQTMRRHVREHCISNYSKKAFKLRFKRELSKGITSTIT